jgi:hypothetical protein
LGIQKSFPELPKVTIWLVGRDEVAPTSVTYRETYNVIELMCPFRTTLFLTVQIEGFYPSAYDYTPINLPPGWNTSRILASSYGSWRTIQGCYAGHDQDRGGDIPHPALA